MDEVERRTEGQGGVHSERGLLALGWPCVAHGRPEEPYSTVLWLENSLLALRAVGRVKCLQQEWEQVGLARCGIMVLRKRNRFPAPSQSPNNV